MDFIANQIDNFKTGAELTDKFMRWAATSALKRLLTLTFVGVLAVGGYYWYVHSLLSEAKHSSQAVQEKVDFVLQAGLYQSVVDWAKLCIASREKKLANADWYCEEAMALYMRRSKGTPPPLREEIINRKAYGAIVVDMSSQLRGVEIDRLYKQGPTEAQQLLGKLLGTTGRALILIGIILLMSITALALVWYAGRSALRMPARTEAEQ